MFDDVITFDTNCRKISHIKIHDRSSSFTFWQIYYTLIFFQIHNGSVKANISFASCTFSNSLRIKLCNKKIWAHKKNSRNKIY